MDACIYKSDDEDPAQSNFLVLQRGGNGDYYVGVKRVVGGVVIGVDSVRFRTGNGGASNHPQLIAALRELFRVMEQINNANKS